jgi:DnaK suppressor protein
MIATLERSRTEMLATPAGGRAEAALRRELELIALRLERAGEERYELSESREPTDDPVIGPLRDLEFRRFEALGDRLRVLGAALERILDGTFGYCEDCGDPIAALRLDADPAVALCRSCQAAHEVDRPIATL